MMKLFVSEFVSLDGVMEAPGGEPGFPHSGWVFDFMSPEHEAYKTEEMRESEALLIGRVTYESFAAAWPERSGEIADKLNAMAKYVASTTLTDPAWNNTTVLDGDVPAAVAELKQAGDGRIGVAGSRTLVHTLFEHGLVDELRLMVFPVILGSGARVFRESPDMATFALVDSQTFRNGVQANTYEAAHVA